MKLLTSILLFAVTIANAEVINLETKQVQSNTPSHFVAADGKVYVGLEPLPLDIVAEKGWRELPKTKPTASVGSVIQSIEYKQDSKDPMKVEAVVTEKLESDIAQEKADAEKAEMEAKTERDAKRQAQRDEITRAFPDEKQFDAIGKLFDLLRPTW